ncbi:MAG: hypothetical protein QGI78_05630 [Phycisphaerales bacterium]|jgi:hypothetical protein|nr:hypothetical protein [Phycisphaerales bacterium]
MPKKRKKKKGSGYKPPAQTEEERIGAVASLAQRISSLDDAGSLWGELHKLLLKTEVDPVISAKIIMHKNVEELLHVVQQLQVGEELSVDQEVCETQLPTLSHETKKQAMRIFRKRVKFIKLDRESKLGIGPLTTGKEAKFDSIEAPHDYGEEVWQVLASEGQLIDDGGGFYRLPE